MNIRYLFELLLVSACLMVACRTDRAPPMKILCTLNGTGAGNCVRADKTRVLLLPSQMNNFFATDQESMAEFSGWCYDVPASTAKVHLDQIQSQLKAPQSAPFTATTEVLPR